MVLKLEETAQGFSGSATRLPHLNQIQQSFGVNLSHVQAYIGGGAAAACNKMGAAAYASGNQIAFKEAPSVELAAHEAAHVVQQQSGKVQLSGGVGQVGDKYEQHADEVAARVGAGQSAGDLLAEYNEDNFPKRVYDIYQQKTENEFKEKRNEAKSLDKSSSDTSYNENIECNSKVEIPIEFVDTKSSSEDSILEKLNQNENLTPESRTKSMRKGSGGILTLYCARARQNTFVYGSIKSYYNPIYAWFIETAFSDGKTFATTDTTLPTLYVKFDFKYERPLSWAQILTAQAEGLFGTMRMAVGVPLETSCPSNRDDEGGAK